MREVRLGRKVGVSSDPDDEFRFYSTARDKIFKWECDLIDQQISFVIEVE